MNPRTQIRVPYPPRRQQQPSAPLRLGPTETFADSYRHNIVRINLPTGPIEVQPGAMGAEPDLPTQQRPADDLRAVRIISGCNVFNRLSTQHDNATTTAALYASLEGLDWQWHPAAVISPGRAWVETAAAIQGIDLSRVHDLARHHGQDAVLTWNQDWLTTTATGLTDQNSYPTSPVPVHVRHADPGCPMQLQDRSAPCVREGGPWVSASREAALVWEHHRHMLVTALGCKVCAGDNVATDGHPYGLTDLFVPSREGGWQWGPRLSELQDPVQPNPTDQKAPRRP